jgi:glyoxylase-like metal-dependent hydrolase (beta-lactamase superfamily II)
VAPDDVHRLELPTPFAIGPVSSYVLKGEPLTLVDPGPRMDRTREALEDGLRDLGLRVEDVELLVLTHQHHDHVGLAAEVRERSGARVAGTDRLAAFLADFDGRWTATTPTRLPPWSATGSTRTPARRSTRSRAASATTRPA